MLIQSFKKLEVIKALVLGDFMIDRYIFGQIDRISPEAPVPIMQVKEENIRPGGAGNVALNLRALGAQCSIIGMIGDDTNGKELLSLLEEKGVDCSRLFLERKLSTIVKSRLIAGSQHIIRLDQEKISPLPSDLEDRVVSAFESIVSEFHIVAFSDYHKGFFTPSLLARLIEIANKKHIRIIVDPKGDDFSKYKGVFTIKPNLKEAYLASKLPKTAPLSDVGSTLLKQANLDQLIITRSEKGISLFKKDGTQIDFPVKTQEVVDVTGAGDTVLATMVFALANGLSLEESIELANMASAIAVSRLGCAHITQKDLAKELLDQSTENKIFDDQHLFALMQALEGERYITLSIEGLTRFNLEHLNYIRELKEIHKGAKTLIYVGMEDPKQGALASLLASFKEIDYLILKEGDFSPIYEALSPEASYNVEENFIINLQ
jgi:rfaE bifunctional protein kinase chain/domain